eukprot:CAMPEP_0114514746 /NCGR_PEP_ID=MMETSP0109-20121206/16328_1 /TAXON_ID=29199 /ORGANISM="Chlorarachnion reptans, Strain CCCM449" /LENGTH=243 /DNA_ID=CAMNT_0001694827 /DNA_START=282 /DNA_END=1014 /DNA_ORIENTATION=+
MNSESTSSKPAATENSSTTAASDTGNQQLKRRQEALEVFAKGDDTKDKELNSELSQIITDVAALEQPGTVGSSLIGKYRETDPKTGEVDGEAFEVRYKRVLDFMEDFKRPPFTLQRICELLDEPQRYYKSTEKFFLAFSKMVCGISYPAETAEEIRMKTEAAAVESSAGASSNENCAGSDKNKMQAQERKNEDEKISSASSEGQSSDNPKDDNDQKPSGAWDTSKTATKTPNANQTENIKAES